MRVCDVKKRVKYLGGRADVMSITGGYEFNIPDYVLTVMERLFARGESVYIVGGSLRDSLLKKRAHDFDLASSAPPEAIKDIFPDMHVIPTGISHGTVTVVSAGHPIELTTFRVDGEYRDMRHPDGVIYTKRIDEDLSRRDFTVNAMAYNTREGLIDLFGGISDLNDRVIRTVRDPYERFNEDALRIMRAFRFSAQLGFEIEEKTLEAAASLADRLVMISKERIFSELLKLICSPYPEKPLRLMRDLGVMKYVFESYLPSDRAIESLSSADNELDRIALLFSDTDGACARRELSALKASNRQRSAAAIVDAQKKCFSKREDIVRLRASIGDDALIALKNSVILGASQKNALDLLGDKTPCSISELAIGGNELIDLGCEGREIGRILSLLLDEVIKDPSLNNYEYLIHRAGLLKDPLKT